MVDKTAPASQLRLEWVYGYRGHQCRNNLFYTIKNEIVYFIAGVGVVLEPRYQKQRFFFGHDDDILCLTLHPEGSLVATGQTGKEPYICVWDSTTCKTISLLKENHQRGVACVAFSPGNGSRLASVGLDDYSQIIIWDWKKGRPISTTRGHSDRIFDVCFNPFEESTLVTCGVKHLKVWNLCGNTLSGRKGIFGKLGEIQSVLCLAFGVGGALYTGTLSGDIYKWQGTSLVENISNAHTGGVFTLNATADGYASGSKDGTVGLWDTEFKPITRIDLNGHSLGYKGISIRSVCWSGEKILVGTNGGEIFEVSAIDKDKPSTLIQGHAEGELWGLATHPKKMAFATGSDDHTVRLWDMNSRSLIAKAAFDLTVRSASFAPDGSTLAIGHGDGSFRILKGRDLSEILHIQDRKEVIHEMKYSPDGSLLAVGSNDNFVDIYAVHEKYKRVSQCKGNSSYITHIDWSEDSAYLQTNSGAAERLFYKMPAGKRVTRKEEIDSIHWQSWTCVLGAEVNGIWEKYTDTTDINATDTNFQHGVIVTGDDFGLVKVFRFPCVKKGAKFRRYTGHSAHVTNVRFTADGMHVITTGGADHAVFQWRLIPEGYVEEGISDTGENENYTQNDSNSDASDSDLSDVDPLDSDIEGEVSKDYKRDIYKEDIPRLKQKIKTLDDGTDSGVQKLKKARSNAPKNGVKLDFVFGFRGYDCRNNLFYTQTGEVVYHVAAVGIVYNHNNHKQRFYLGHDDDILSLTLHPIKDLVATGQIGRDPSIHVWDTERLEAVSILKGHHTHGICALDFTADGKKLVSVGLDDHHVIVVWDWRRGEKLSTARGHKDKIFEVRCDPNDIEKMVTVGVRHIKFWTQAGGGLTSKRGTYGDVGKAETQLCATFPKEAGVLVTGASNGQLYIWKDEVLQNCVSAHQGPVFAIHALEKGFVSGGKDGVVCLWDETLTRCLKSYKVNRASLASNQPKDILVRDNPAIRAVTLGQGKILVGTKNGEICEIDKSGPITCLIQGHCEGEIWGLAYHPCDHQIATLSDDKSLRVWDLTKFLLVRGKILTKPGRCVAYSPDGKYLALGFNDGSFIVLDGESFEQVAEHHHRKEEIADIKFSPVEGKYLAVASHDNIVDIYNVLTKSRVGVCKSASSYITHIDWDDRGKLLQVNTGAKEVLYFEAPRGKRQAITSAELKKITWNSWTCVLGKACEGIWEPRADITDINAADLNKDGSLIATGDDFGYVKLFDYPSKGKNAKCKKYNGHSAHVTNVRWSHDDRYLVSVGGADTAVMVWRSLDHEETTVNDTADQSDDDSDEESGYDSDVEREKNIDYTSKIYTNPIRDHSGALKPQQQQRQNIQTDKKVSRSRNMKTKVETKAVDGKKKRTHEFNELELDFILGYRGFDTRNNLHYSVDGDLVYHAAGAGIIHDTQSQSQSFYLEHTDDIICMCANQNPKYKNIVATGQIGASPTIRVWDTTSKQTLSIIQGFHTKGVCSVNFSSSGRYLVSVGIDDQHSIAVYKWADGTKVASSIGHTQRIFVAEFRPDSDTSFVTCGVKHVKWWTVKGGTLVSKGGNFSTYDGDAQMQTMLSVAFGPNDATFTGAMSGDVYIWISQSLTRLVKNVHSGPVFSMFTTVKDGLIVTGGKDKSSNDKEYTPIKLWDQELKRCKSFTIGKPVSVKSVCRNTSKGLILVGTMDNEIYEINEKSGVSKAIVQGHLDGEIWGLTSHPSRDLVATSSDDTSLRIWDLSTKNMLRKVDLGSPAKCCCYSSDGSALAVGLNTGEFMIVDSETLKVISKKRDRNKPVTAVRFSGDGKLLAIGTEDKSVDFYSVKPQIKRVGYCKNLSSFVTQIDFSNDANFIQVCTGSYERLIFAVPDGAHVADEKKVSEITWNTWTSTLGDDVIGIWPKASQNGDVNCAHLTNSGKMLATGDDFGFVKLFLFPVRQKFTKGLKYVGHSAHVTNVRFTHDDKHVVSTGGDDSCVFVWRCV